MLPKINRIAKNLEIKKAIRTNFYIKNEYFIISARKNNLNISRLLIIVSKKVYKKANLRNKIKRRLFHVFSDFVKTSYKNSLRGNFDFVIRVTSKEILLIKYQTLYFNAEDSSKKLINKIKNFSNKKL